MKILVCGGRDFKNEKLLAEVLNEYYIEMIISGGARGADALAEQYGYVKGIHVAVVRANWEYYGRSAGPIRNVMMLKLKPDLVIAFPGGSGTANMVYLAKRNETPIREVFMK